MSDRLTMFSSAQNGQLGLRHCSGVCLDFICLDLFLSDGLLALLECLCCIGCGMLTVGVSDLYYLLWCLCLVIV